MLYRLGLTLGLLLSFGITSAATAANLIESQPNVLYTGASGQTDNYQPLGTGYTATTGSLEIDAYTGNASTTVYLQECTSSAYSSCTTAASTTSFVLISDTNFSNPTTVSWRTPYTMISSKYYRLRLFASDFRLQCGGTSSMTPISGADATPTTACTSGGDTGRAWYFKLYDYTAPDTMTSSIQQYLYLMIVFLLFAIMFYISYILFR